MERALLRHCEPGLDGEVVVGHQGFDAEGFEPHVMRGAQSLIGKTEVFLLEACLKPPPPNWPEGGGE